MGKYTHFTPSPPYLALSEHVSGLPGEGSVVITRALTGVGGGDGDGVGTFHILPSLTLCTGLLPAAG